MPMEIDRTTYMEADDKTGRGLQYDLFTTVISRMDTFPCATRAAMCDARLRKLETSWAKLAGGVLVLAIVGPLLFNWLVK